MLHSTASRLVKYKSVSLDRLHAAAGSVFPDGGEAASNAVEQKVRAIHRVRVHEQPQINPI